MSIRELISAFDQVSESFPLTPLQQGMLFHALYAPQSGLDIEQIVCDLAEPIDRGRLLKAWHGAVAAHPALRVSLRWEQVEEPAQIVHECVDIAIDSQDWRGRPAGQQAQDFKAFLSADRLRGFDMASPPLMRFTLFQLADEQFRLVWTFHHVLLDGRSFPIVLRKVFDEYDHGRADSIEKPHASPSLRRHVEWLRSRDASGDECYWRAFLDGFGRPTTLDLGRTLARSDGELGEMGEIELRLSAGDTQALEQCAASAEVSLNTLVQASWGWMLARYSGSRDVIFGAVCAGRHSAAPDAMDTVGVFINVLPVRITIDPEREISAWVRSIRQQSVAMRPHEQASLIDIHRWSNLASDAHLLHSLIVYDHASLDGQMHADGITPPHRRFQLIERTAYPLTLYAYGENEMLLKLTYDRSRFEDETIATLLDFLRETLLAIAGGTNEPMASLPQLTRCEESRLLREWNATEVEYSANTTIHDAFAAQVSRNPGAPAIAFEEQSLTYGELDARANRLARVLVRKGVGPDSLVGVSVRRSPDLIVTLLAVLKAGGAYVPMDPVYPARRIAYMLEDSDARILIVDSARQRAGLPPSVDVVDLSSDWPAIENEDASSLETRSGAAHMAYLLYTSGSTGMPKGVMVEHRNVINFFEGMDARVGKDPGVWLAVTSISFDISVLELLWTLTRGFKVVLDSGEDRRGETVSRAARHADRAIEFSLFFWNVATEVQQGSRETYRLLIEAAKFADRNGFTAVWTPERHFGTFGGIYPNPSVTSAALAMVTERVKLRAGSCVLPLHNPIRVAEEWAVVDNLSNGRVGLALASGWQPSDFVLKPENHADAKNVMFESANQLQRLWRGEAVGFPGPRGEVQVRTLPRPVQKELPLWVTSAGSPETYVKAAQLGAGVLTHLLGQTAESVAEKVALYRKTWKECGHPGEGHVTLMLHTLVGDNDAQIKELARQPMKNYLRSAMALVKDAAWHFPAFKDMSSNSTKSLDEFFATISETDLDALLDFAFERYYGTSGLFGSIERCREMVDSLKGIGIDEIACLVDFGVPTDVALGHLGFLDELRQATADAIPAATGQSPDYGIAALIERHAATHFQCTPSMATMLVNDVAGRAAMGRLGCMMVGGEALSSQLARELRQAVGGRVLNMYGPTETTVWSTTHELRNDLGNDSPVPIGYPIANTRVYVLDQARALVPVGVPGELYIGGDSVVRGYHGRAELTLERFVPDHLAGRPGARLYRTGDLVRRRVDGNIDFLGRIDHQVKIRGHRVEPGEIESHILHQPGVRSAVVVMREDVPGDQRLVAYLVAREGRQIEVDGTRESLTATLPDYLVPSTFVVLDGLPMTPNGKIDRKALPSPVPGPATLRRVEYVAPQSELEQTVAGIWQHVLRLRQVGLDDNFFELGGHSLLTVHVLSEIRTRLGRSLSLTDLFRHPTVRTLANSLRGDEPGDAAVTGAQDRGASRRAALQRRGRGRG